MIVKLSKKCPYCRQLTWIDVDYDKLKRWQSGENIQNVWPEKTPGERELIKTGIHEACWNSIFSKEED